MVVENVRRFAFEESFGLEIQNVSKATDTKALSDDRARLSWLGG